MIKSFAYWRKAILLRMPIAFMLCWFAVQSVEADEANTKPTQPNKDGKPVNVVFLHHSTGRIIWNAGVPNWIKTYNQNNKQTIQIEERAYPKKSPYGWKNYPFDYYNIWVTNAGDQQFKEEDTLEMLTKKYDVIVFKHCFPVSSIAADKERISPDTKTLENYQSQYEELKKKMNSFPNTKFIVWTGAALTREATTEDKAQRAKKFFDWVKNKWDIKGDNIFVWDFRELETDGGLYLKDEYAVNKRNSHPNETLAARAAPLFCRRLVEVINGNGDKTSLTGK